MMQQKSKPYDVLVEDEELQKIVKMLEVLDYVVDETEEISKYASCMLLLAKYDLLGHLEKTLEQDES